MHLSDENCSDETYSFDNRLRKSHEATEFQCLRNKEEYDPGNIPLKSIILLKIYIYICAL